MIKDLQRNGTGGSAELKSGGVNYRYVVIDFTSKVGGDIYVNVTIFGDASHGPLRGPFPIGWKPPQQQPPPGFGWNQPNRYQYGG